MEYTTINVEREDKVAILKLNRPEALNALNSRMVSELMDALDKLNEEKTRCIVITGDERAFSAGADIKEMVNMNAVDMAMTEHFFPLWDKVGRYPKPLIAAVSGFVLGGGLELAMSCDIIVASETAVFGQPEIDIGVMPGGGGTQRLARTLGKYKSMEIILTGKRINAEEAYRFGLVNLVVPKELYLEEAKRIARIISEKSPVAVKLAKAAINKAFEVGLSQGLDFERELFYLLFSSQDKEEGMKAFIEKRKPEFRGR
jgi:enoyl-CoA hydratase